MCNIKGSKKGSGKIIKCKICGKDFYVYLRGVGRYKTCGSEDCKKKLKSRVTTHRHKTTNLSELAKKRWLGSKNPRYNQDKEIHKKVRKFCYQSVYRVLLRYGNSKPSKTYDLLGYNAVQLKNHIEGKFRDGMNWENRSKWDIDHIVPIDYYLKKGITDLSIINALTNLQPMWRKENISKANKYIISKS
jgi:hypothetical protein